MKNLAALFGQSPFGPMVEHARKVHACVEFIRPIAEVILAGDMDKLKDLQHDVSKTEYEADQVKDSIRAHLPSRYFLPVNRDDLEGYLSQMDKIADGAEDFAVVATFRVLAVPAAFHKPFLEFVDKVLETSRQLLSLAEKLTEVQKESFVGADADDVLKRIQDVSHLEWEADKLSRRFARQYYATEGIPPVTIMLLEKLCRALSAIADHAENVGKNLRLMILRK